MLARRAERAFREFVPLADGLDGPMRLYRKFSFGPRLDLLRLDMRSFRAANGPNRQEVADKDTALLGLEQVGWLKQALKASTATWKIVAADMPLGLVVYDDWRRTSDFEAVANADDGPPSGTSRRSTNSCRVRSQPAASAPTPSMARSAHRSCSRRCRRRAASISRRSKAPATSATSGSTGSPA